MNGKRYITMTLIETGKAILIKIDYRAKNIMKLFSLSLVMIKKKKSQSIKGWNNSTVMHLKRGWKTHEPKSHRTSRETDKSIIIVGDANLSLSIVDKSSRLKIRRLQETWNQSTRPNWHWWNTLPKGSPRHTIRTVISLHKFNRSQKSVFSDHNGIKIEINNTKICETLSIFRN